MIVERTSILTGITRRIRLSITIEQVQKYHNGALLQNAFPNLTADQREFYKTGITPDEWDSLLSNPNEDFSKTFSL